MRLYWEVYFYLSLGMYPFLKKCPPEYKEYFIKKRKALVLGYEPNFTIPKTMNEKIWWLMHHGDLDAKTKLTDKIAVKDWVSEKIGEQYIAKTYKTYTNPDEINYDELPNKFVIKASHGCRMNIFVENKNIFLEKYKNKANDCMRSWINVDYSDFYGEIQYKNITPKILIEEYTNNARNKRREDYSIHCFNGNPIFIEHNLIYNKKIHSPLYSIDGKQLNFAIGKEFANIDFEIPDKLEEMMYISKTLSKDFRYVRVDLRYTGENILFGEMTFTPLAGLIKFSKKGKDLEFGEKIIL